MKTPQYELPNMRSLDEVLSEIRERYNRPDTLGVLGFSITVRAAGACFNTRWGELRLKKGLRRLSKTKRFHTTP